MPQYPHPPQIAASILAGDFAHLADEARRVEESGADALHIDVMDGHFVPNLTMGPQIVSAINRSTSLFLDVHLMIYNPFEYIERFVEAGADRITFHLEATEDVEETLEYIRKCNVKAGLALCPETPVSLITKYLTQCDMVLLMTVHPGFGGQAFMSEVLEKIEFTRTVCNTLNIRQGGIVQEAGTKEILPPFDIQVDGGINETTAAECAKVGANIFVVGSHLFRDKHLKANVKSMRDAVTTLS